MKTTIYLEDSVFHCKYIIYIQLLESTLFIFLSSFFFPIFSIKLPPLNLPQTKLMPFAVISLQHDIYFLILHTSSSLREHYMQNVFLKRYLHLQNKY